jgi:hypothetical protein
VNAWAETRESESGSVAACRVPASTRLAVGITPDQLVATELASRRHRRDVVDARATDAAGVTLDLLSAERQNPRFTPHRRTLSASHD